MSFDQDPTESITLSGADFAQMVDEIKTLQRENAELKTYIANIEFMYDGLKVELEAQPAQSVPAGWQLVPIEPTPAMYEAAKWARPNIMQTDMAIIFNFMRAAAPTPATKENNMEHADILIKISNLETAIESLPEDADRANLLIKAGNLRAAIENAQAA